MKITRTEAIEIFVSGCFSSIKIKKAIFTKSSKHILPEKEISMKLTDI
jgi:hypothetical protein